MEVMRWYHAFWCCLSHPFVSGTGDLYGVEEWHLRIGKPAERWISEAWIQSTEPESDGEPSDVLQNHLGLPIYSPRLQRLVEKNGVTGIQFLPLHVRQSGGREIPGFAIANILNFPAAMDLEESEYDVFEDDYFAPGDRGKVEGVHKMVLRSSAIAGVDIIRVREFHPPVYVSERFKEMFENAGCAGYEFQEVEVS